MLLAIAFMSITYAVCLNTELLEWLSVQDRAETVFVTVSALSVQYRDHSKYTVEPRASRSRSLIDAGSCEKTPAPIAPTATDTCTLSQLTLCPTMKVANLRDTG